jgi:cysteine-S-conjugate beta-lyase
MLYNFDEIIDRTNTSCVKWDYTDRFLNTKEVLPMWVADMDFKTPDFIVNAVRKRAEHEVFGYTLRPDSYYSSIVDWVKKKHNWQIEKDWIVFSPGVVPALNMAVMAYTKPGEKIIVQPPVYFPFFSAVTKNGRKLVYNPLKLMDGRYYMDFDDLERKIDNKTRMIILCNPHNPGGSAWTADELVRVGEICIKNNLLLVSDDIHSDLVFDPFRHTVAASLSDELAKITITMMAPSKTFNLAGMSTASVIISNASLRKRFQATVEKLHIGMGNIFGMVASEAAYTHGEDWLVQMMNYVNGNLTFMEKFLTRNLPSIEMIRPEATYLVWLDFRKLNLPPEQMNKVLKEKAKIGLSDGATFGPGGEGFQRMNVACPRLYVEKAMDQLCFAFKQGT